MTLDEKSVRLRTTARWTMFARLVQRLKYRFLATARLIFSISAFEHRCGSQNMVMKYAGSNHLRNLFPKKLPMAHDLEKQKA